MKRPTALVLAMAIAAAGLFGCAEPSNRATPSGPPDSTQGGGPTIGPSPGADVGALAPCTLLTEPEQANLNLGAGQDRMNKGHRVCAFPATDETFVVAVSVYPDEGLDAIVPDTILKGPMRIGRHDAVQHHENNTVCVFSIAVGTSSSVDVGSAFAKQAKDVTPDDFARSCELAQQAAALVEPRLP